MKTERMKVGDNYREFVRQKTIGADFDIEHDQMIRNQARLAGMRVGEYLKSVVIPIVDARQEQIDAAAREILQAE